jgi:hypothetical protein
MKVRDRVARSAKATCPAKDRDGRPLSSRLFGQNEYQLEMRKAPGCAVATQPADQFCHASGRANEWLWSACNEVIKRQKLRKFAVSRGDQLANVIMWKAEPRDEAECGVAGQGCERMKDRGAYARSDQVIKRQKLGKFAIMRSDQFANVIMWEATDKLWNRATILSPRRAKFIIKSPATHTLIRACLVRDSRLC